jgi:hypothetical protein
MSRIAAAGGLSPIYCQRLRDVDSVESHSQVLNSKEIGRCGGAK